MICDRMLLKSTFAIGLRLGGDLNEASTRGESGFAFEDISADFTGGSTTPVRTLVHPAGDDAKRPLLSICLMLIQKSSIGREKRNFATKKGAWSVTCMRLACAGTLEPG